MEAEEEGLKKHEERKEVEQKGEKEVENSQKDD